MLDRETIDNDQLLLEKIALALERSVVTRKEGLVALSAQLLRQAIDEVIDAPRTGRLLLRECEKTEKTYLGTKIEILLRALMKLEKGRILDLSVGGIEVDIKHTIGRSWMIPREALNQVCLLVCENEKTSKFRLGLLVCRPENLNVKSNQDSKFGISARGLDNALWLADWERYPRNIWLDFDPDLLSTILKLRGGTKRLSALFENYQRKPVARSAITALAPQLDPLKRLRKNGGARSALTAKGIAILSGKFHRATIAELDLPPLYNNEFISVAANNDRELAILRLAGQL